MRRTRGQLDDLRSQPLDFRGQRLSLGRRALAELAEGLNLLRRQLDRRSSLCLSVRKGCARPLRASRLFLEPLGHPVQLSPSIDEITLDLGGARAAALRLVKLCRQRGNLVAGGCELDGEVGSDGVEVGLGDSKCLLLLVPRRRCARVINYDLRERGLG